MTYDIKFNPAGDWKFRTDSISDESGVEISHVEARLPAADGKKDDILIDIYAGKMPEGESAEDQAFANYAETVGFDEDDTDPICKFKFNGRNAWGFEALTEDDFPMRFISQEVRSGVLLIVVYCVSDEERLDEVFSLLERNLRIG